MLTAMPRASTNGRRACRRASTSPRCAGPCVHHHRQVEVGRRGGRSTVSTGGGRSADHSSVKPSSTSVPRPRRRTSKSSARARIRSRPRPCVLVAGGTPDAGSHGRRPGLRGSGGEWVGGHVGDLPDPVSRGSESRRQGLVSHRRDRRGGAGNGGREPWDEPAVGRRPSHRGATLISDPETRHSNPQVVRSWGRVDRTGPGDRSGEPSLVVRLAAPTSDAAGRGPGGVWERRSRPRTRKMETSTPAKMIAAHSSNPQLACRERPDAAPKGMAGRVTGCPRHPAAHGRGLGRRSARAPRSAGSAHPREPTSSVRGASGRRRGSRGRRSRPRSGRCSTRPRARRSRRAPGRSICCIPSTRVRSSAWPSPGITVTE